MYIAIWSLVGICAAWTFVAMLALSGWNLRGTTGYAWSFMIWPLLPYFLFGVLSWFSRRNANPLVWLIGSLILLIWTIVAYSGGNAWRHGGPVSLLTFFATPIYLLIYVVIITIIATVLRKQNRTIAQKDSRHE